MTFEEYGRELDRTPEADLVAPDSQQPDALLMVEEAKIGCTSAMLLCLDREQRLVYVLGEISDDLDVLTADYAELHRRHPFHESPDFASSLRALLERSNIETG